MEWELISKLVFAVDIWAIYRDIVAFIMLTYGSCSSLMIKGIVLWIRTNTRMRYRRKLEDRKKQKSPDGWSIGGVPVFLFKPSEKKYDANLAICSAKKRADFIETLPGKSCRHNPKHGNLLAHAIHVYQTQPIRRWAALWYYRQKVRNLAERGLIHHLTDSEHRYIAADFEPYRSSIAGGRYTPTADKALSDFARMDIIYRVPSDNLDIKKFIERESIFEGRWGCPVEISRPIGFPGAVRVRPRPKLEIRRWTPTAVKGLKTHLVFGRDRLTAQIMSLDLKKIALSTQVMLLGPIGSGKTNHVGLWLSQLRDMANANCADEDKIVSVVHFIDPKGATGLGQYQCERVRFATDMESIKAELDLIEAYYVERERIKGAAQANEWDGPLRVVIFDEFQALMLGWGNRSIETRMIQWSNDFRKAGIFLMFATQRARAQEGIPMGVTYNCGVRIIGRVDDPLMVSDFIAPLERFRHGLNPLQLDPTRGQFVMRHPWSTEFVYGQTDLAEHAPKSKVA